jgi:hypothetical protein
VVALSGTGWLTAKATPLLLVSNGLVQPALITSVESWLAKTVAESFVLYGNQL